MASKLGLALDPYTTSVDTPRGQPRFEAARHDYIRLAECGAEPESAATASGQLTSIMRCLTTGYLRLYNDRTIE